MPLPDNNTPYPLPTWAPIYTKYREWVAWWEGDTSGLTQTYAAQYAPRPSQHAGGLVGAVSRFFWGKPGHTDTTASQLHLPVAADLATTSAEQVYANQPEVTVNEADPRGQELVDQYLTDGLTATLLEGTESGAVFGGRFHTIITDPSVHAGRPFLTTVHADNAFPEFRWGELVAVTFVWHLDSHNEIVNRHVERHELDEHGNGIIQHALYQGTRTNLGEQQPLTAHPATRLLAEPGVLRADGVTANLPLTPGLWCDYVPNMRPQRAWRTHPVGRFLGRSDYAGIEPWLDQIDHAYSEWVTDLDLSRGRLIVDEAFLDVSPDLGGGTRFNTDRRIFTPINGMGDTSMEQVQFAMRVDDLAATIDHFTAKVIQSAGWSQATFGEHSGDTDITATEIRAREKRTLTKRARRINEEQASLKRLLTKMLALEGYAATHIEIDWPASVSPDAKELAETTQLLRIAGAASRYTLVKTAHPDWTDAQISEEVARILQDERITSPTANWEPTLPPVDTDEE